jgi:SAM-dependent methyltransferase
MLSEYAYAYPESVDVVCSFQVLEHLCDPSGYFSSCFKVPKPGGRLLTSVPSEDSFVGSCSNNILNAPPHHLTRWTDQALRSFPSSLGFKCLEIIHLPVETQHFMWFWSLLIQRGMLRDGCSDEENAKSLISRIKAKWQSKFLLDLVLILKFSQTSSYQVTQLLQFTRKSPVELT